MHGYVSLIPVLVKCTLYTSQNIFAYHGPLWMGGHNNKKNPPSFVV